jgi:competence protein ComEC
MSNGKGLFHKIPSIFLGLTAGVVSLFFFSPNIYTFFALIFLLQRLFRIRNVIERRSCFIGGVVVLLFCFNFQQASISHRAQEEKNLVLQTIPDTIKVDGDSVSLQAGDVQLFIQCNSEQEKRFWETLTQSLELEVDGEFELPESDRNEGGFDYALYYKAKKLKGTLAVVRYTIQNTSGNWDFHRLRRTLIVHAQTHFPNPLKEYMTGLLFGYFTKDFNESRELYKHLGVLHLFAISGMHIHFFLEWFRKFMRFLRVSSFTLNIGMLLVSIFLFGITGGNASVFRSLVQTNGERFRIDAQKAFGLALFLQVLLQPMVLFTSGGQLSYGLGFLILFIRPALKYYRGIKKELLFNVFLSLGIIPILLWNFYEWQPLSIFLTFLLGRLFQFALLPVITSVFVLSFWINVPLVNSLFQNFESGLTWSTQLVSSGVVLGKPSPLMLIILIFESLSLILMLEERKWRRIPLYVLFGLLFFGVATHAPIGKLSMIDVGQGDCILIHEPFSSNATLIDVGGQELFLPEEEWQERHAAKPVEKHLLPLLKSRGIQEIKQVFITHGHRDHMGNLVDLAESIPIRNVYFLAGSERFNGFQKTLDSLEDLGVVVKGIQAPIKRDGYEILFPSRFAIDGGNNDSLIIKKEIKNKMFLFMGDAEVKEETELLDMGLNLQADVLKVGHHGSKSSTSDAFLSKVTPELALISCGKKNRFLHPHKEVIKKFERLEIPVLRTDEQGEIYFTLHPFSVRLGKSRSVLGME